MTNTKNHTIEGMDVNKVGFYSAILTALVTLASFFMVKPPISGPFCTDSCIGYPYIDIISQFPKDYIWMYFMVALMIIYVVFMVSVHFHISKEKKIFSQIGLYFSLISAIILLTNYFVQLSVIQPSLLNGETDGISILTQYNPHGIFIALEDLGYLIMSISFLFFALAFTKNNRLDKVIRWIFLIGFLLSLCSFLIVSFLYGINREYIFECIVIVIDWIVLIINGILLSIVFKQAMKKSANNVTDLINE